jgi:nucleotide-binding universal stress UspA family protein
MRVLLASDGSAAARAALAVALGFPWPDRARVRGVVALGRTYPGMNARRVRMLHARADELRKALRRKWSGAEVFELHDRPAEAILREAERFRADVVVVGWRGHGRLSRLIAGSVSRKVAEGARCAVLVVRAAVKPPVLRFVMGFDGSRHSGRATRFMARLRAPRGNRVAVVSVAPPPPSRPVRLLRSKGWNAAAVVRAGEPVREILEVAAKARAQVLVVGGAAAGLLDRSRLPVLVAR